MQRSQFGPAVEERVDWFFTARSWTRRAADRRAREGGVAGVVRAGRPPRADGAARGPRPRAPLLRGRLPHLRVGRSPERGWPERDGRDRIHWNPGRESMNDEELSPMPEPYTEEPQLVPGGIDALDEDPADAGLARDLTPTTTPPSTTSCPTRSPSRTRSRRRPRARRRTRSPTPPGAPTPTTDPAPARRPRTARPSLPPEHFVEDPGHSMTRILHDHAARANAQSLLHARPGGPAVPLQQR